MFLSKVYTVIFLSVQWMMIPCRSDHKEGSRLLEEAFRDYDKRFRPNYGGSPVLVNVSFHILSVSEIDSASMTFKMSFFIRQMWIDPELSFNSRRNIDTITLDASTSDRIWVPDTFFVNELTSVNHDVLVKNQFCRISQDGSVLLSRRVTLTAFSPMDTNKFPYDTHQLRLELESYGLQTKDLKYQWSSEEISSHAELIIPGYLVDRFLASDSSKTTSTGSYSRLSLEIDIKRNPLPYEVGAMLPVCFLSFLCLCSTWIQKSANAFVIAIFVLSVISILYGQLVFYSTGYHRNENIQCMSPFQIYFLLSGGFGCLCLLYNLTVGKPTESWYKTISEHKSRIESKSENCKIDDELQAAVATSLDIGKCSAQESKFGKMLKCMGQKRSRSRLEYFIQCSLLTAFIAYNTMFLVLFRYL